MGLDVLSIIISGCAFVFSLWSFVSERNRGRKEATIHAFDDLEEKICSKEYGELQKLDGAMVSKIVEGHERNNSLEQPKWDEITKGLALIEHFAVGVNAKVYDAETLNSMAGNFMIRLYNTLFPIIEQKQKSPDGKNNYKQFEQMMKELKCLRPCSCV